MAQLKPCPDTNQKLCTTENRCVSLTKPFPKSLLEIIPFRIVMQVTSCQVAPCVEFQEALWNCRFVTAVLSSGPGVRRCLF